MVNAVMQIKFNVVLFVLFTVGVGWKVHGANQVWFWAPDWQSAQLITLNTTNLTTNSKAMSKNTNGWWFAETNFNVYDFAFGNGNTINYLGRVGGCYSNSHYQCEEQSKNPEFYSSANKSVWVKDGITYPYNPVTQKNRNQFLTVLTLNLHTYQEYKTPGVKDTNLTHQDVRERIEKHRGLFSKIAHAIETLDADLVCLQEVGEWQASDLTFGKSNTNAANIILSQLSNYNVFQDWAHYGWDIWKEGSAILTKHPILSTDSKYISNTDRGTTNYWKSRNVVNAVISTPKIDLNVYSVHSGWSNDPDEPFDQQFKRLHNWLGLKDRKSAGRNLTSILCGDFNQESAKEGYKLITEQYGYKDQYLAAIPQGLHHSTIGGDYWDSNQRQTISTGKRIDYIFMEPSNALEAVQAQRIFTEDVFGRVSDHLGVYVHFKIVN